MLVVYVIGTAGDLSYKHLIHNERTSFKNKMFRRTSDACVGFLLL